MSPSEMSVHLGGGSTGDGGNVGLVAPIPMTSRGRLLAGGMLFRLHYVVTRKSDNMLADVCGAVLKLTHAVHSSNGEVVVHSRAVGGATGGAALRGCIVLYVLQIVAVPIAIVIDKS